MTTAALQSPKECPAEAIGFPATVGHCAVCGAEVTAPAADRVAREAAQRRLVQQQFVALMNSRRSRRKVR